MPNDTLSCTDISIRVDKPAPARVIISALEIIQPGLLALCIAAVANLGAVEMEENGAKGFAFTTRGEAPPPPGG